MQRAAPPRHGSSTESSERCSHGIQMEGQQVAVRVFGVGLVENRSTGRQLQRVRIAEPAHARQRSEVMIERAVFLHQQDDMLDVAKRCGPRRLLRQRPPQVRGHQCGRCRRDGCPGGPLQYPAAGRFRWSSWRKESIHRSACRQFNASILSNLGHYFSPEWPFRNSRVPSPPRGSLVRSGSPLDSKGSAGPQDRRGPPLAGPNPVD